MSINITYEIEGGFDFFKELKQIVPASSSAAVCDSGCACAVSLLVEDARCLITDEKLRKDHIVLKCGHKFNYVPLFKEVLFQKCSLLPKNLSAKIITTYTMPVIVPSTASANTSHPTYMNQQSNVTSVLYNSSYNLETTKLNYNEIKCPYCRAITPYILPYYPYPDVCKVKYVNFPSNLALASVSCEYEKFVSGGTSEHDDNSCRALCMYNEKYDLILCNKHLNKLETKSSSTKKKKSKQNKEQPINNGNIDDENVIISHHNPATATCSFVLLSGPRKGTPCEKPSWVPKTGNVIHTHTHTHTQTDAFCKAHYGKANA